MPTYRSHADLFTASPPAITSDHLTNAFAESFNAKLKASPRPFVEKNSFSPSIAKRKIDIHFPVVQMRKMLHSYLTKGFFAISLFVAKKILPLD